MRGGGRKKLKQGALNGGSELQPGQTIRRVISLRGSNIIEVEDEGNATTLCLLPAKFNKILWIRKGSFVVVEEGDRERALESGNKVTGIICQVLFEEQIRSLKKSLTWPTCFEDSKTRPHSQREGNNSKDNVEKASNNDESCCDVDNDNLPPLESNQNRRAMQFDLEESSSRASVGKFQRRERFCCRGWFGYTGLGNNFVTMLNIPLTQASDTCLSKA
ncbi:hypothetical protein GOP47_0021516 [Adiantum capillus-veneris]|uniref:S1-like domain-containing protein n=1 Tax=Adiantum capillus-veneris TaxID=13818 RepID=A0A9D4U9F5_ADICA|nr:hypothetical protein GOP47_0021516 [Adiantum capillus-veneris]